MKLEIILTPKAKDTFLATIIFIKLKWGEKSAGQFVEKAYAGSTPLLNNHTFSKPIWGMM